MAELRQMDVGFRGGPVLAVRATTKSYENLAKALDDKVVQALGDDSASRWHTLETEDSEILVDLAQIVYVRRESGDQKVGF